MKMNLQTNAYDVNKTRKKKFFHLFTIILCLFATQGWGQAYTITWQGLTGNTAAQNVPTGIVVTQQYNGVQSSCGTSSNGATTSYSCKLTAAPGYNFTITSIGGSAYGSSAGSKDFTVNLVNGSYSGNGPTTRIGTSSSCGGNTALTAFSVPTAGQTVSSGTTVTITVLRAPGGASGGGYSWTRSLTVTGVVTPVAAGNAITTGTISGSPFCAGATVSVPFTSTGTFTAGNDYTAELSDATGSFANPVNIGTLTSTAASGTINATIPVATAAGTGYRIRVIGSAPATTGAANTSNLAIAVPATPSVTVAAGATGTTICDGTSVTITATPSNEGTTPMYQWKKNGADEGTPTSNATYTSATLANNDEITVELTSSLTCVTSATATSATGVTMTVNQKVTPTVSVSTGSVGTSVCDGVPVQFTATPTNEGTTPMYQWKKNGTDDGAPTTSATYTPATLADGDDVSVELTSSETCVTAATAMSADVTMTVNTQVTPTVTVAAGATGTTICDGTPVTFTATPAHEGTSPMYQWKKNGINDGVPTSSATYTPAALADGDDISVELTSSETCVTAATATSTDIAMTVNQKVTPSVAVASGAGTTICEGTQVTFTATPSNEGTTPMYQWKKGGINDGAPTSSNTYAPATLANNDVVSVELTSSEACVTAATANSVDITMTVNQKVTPAVSVAANPGTTVCEGTAVTFTATAVNEGTNPSYEWKKGTAIVGANSATYVDNTLADGEDIMVTVTSSETCVTATTAISSPVTMTVNANLIPSVTIASAPGNTICEGTSVTFTATPQNGGLTPVYEWTKGTTVVGTNSNTYSDNTLINGDVITVKMLSSEACFVDKPFGTDGEVMTVNSKVIPTVNIVANPGTTVTAGVNVTFQATITNAGPAPVYQWQKNGANISGANASSYITNALTNNDVISCVVLNDNECAINDTTRSNSLVMKVSPTGISNVSFANNNITLYPNPNKGIFNIEAAVDASDVQFEILNAIGQVVYQEAMSVNSGKLNGKVNLSGMKQGVYMLRLHTANGGNVIRFVISE